MIGCTLFSLFKSRKKRKQTKPNEKNENWSKFFLLKLMSPRCYCHAIKFSRSFRFNRLKCHDTKKNNNNKIGIIKANTRFHFIHSRSIYFGHFLPRYDRHLTFDVSVVPYNFQNSYATFQCANITRAYHKFVLLLGI